MVDKMGVEPRAPGRANRSSAQLARDAALRRVGRTRRFMIAGAAVLSAAVAAFVSAIAPGKTLGAGAKAQSAPSSGTAPRASGSTQMPPLASPAALGLQGPSQAPAPAPSQSQAPVAPADPSQGAPAPAPQASGGGGVVSGGS